MTEEDSDKLEMIVNGYKEYGDDPHFDVTDWEREFMNSTIERIETYGLTRTRVSEKQWAVLDRIYGKLPL